MSGRRTIIAGGTLATHDGTMKADVVIEAGRVAAIADPGTAGDADELIDASGLVVMPGAIDMHSHFEDPGHTEREDFTTGTMSAAMAPEKMELSDGTVEGNDLAWKAALTQPMPMTLEFAATVDGDSMSGKVKLGTFGDATFEGTRA